MIKEGSITWSTEGSTINLSDSTTWGGEIFSKNTKVYWGDIELSGHINLSHNYNTVHEYFSGNPTSFMVYATTDGGNDDMATTSGIITQTWSGSELSLGHQRESKYITPVGQIQIRVNGGVAIPIAGKYLGPAARKSIDMLMEMGDSGLADLVNTSARYASMMMPVLIDKLYSMLHLCDSEIAPGIYRPKDGGLFATCAICKYANPKKKSKIRVAMERLPIAGIGVMPLEPSAEIINSHVIRQYGNPAYTSQFNHKQNVGSIATCNTSVPFVIMYEINTYVADWYSKIVKDDESAIQEYKKIAKLGGVYDGVYIVLMYDDHPEVIGPISENTHPSILLDAINAEHEIKLSSKRYTYAVKAVRKLIEDIGPIKLVSYTDGKKIGVADVRNLISIEKDTGSEFFLWMARGYYGATSYARDLFLSTYNESMSSRTGSLRKTISTLAEGVSHQDSKTLAYLLPQDSCTVFAVTKEMKASTAMSHFKTDHVYVRDIGASVESKRLVAGYMKQFNWRNSIGVLLDGVPSDAGTFRLASPNEVIPMDTWCIALEKSQEELLAQV